MSTFNPLIAFANAYDCKPAIEALDKIPCDQIRINYFPYPDNYFEVEKFFESHKEYTHLLYLAPDVVLDEMSFDCMVEELKKNDYDVYGPVCNVDTGKYENRLACCTNLPTLEYSSRRYNWLSEALRQHLLGYDKKIIQVKFNAGLHWVKREIKDKIKYTTIPKETDERPIWETKGGYACDLAFSHWLDHLGIKIMVDMRYKLKHLRYAAPLQVGKKEPNVEFFKYKDNKIELCQCLKK